VHLNRLSLDEKAPLLTARESPKGGVPGLGLPEYDWGANCIHGVQSRCGEKCPTTFPNPNAQVSLLSFFSFSLFSSLSSPLLYRNVSKSKHIDIFLMFSSGDNNKTSQGRRLQSHSVESDGSGDWPRAACPVVGRHRGESPEQHPAPWA